jgi:hypothetical protein
MTAFLQTILSYLKDNWDVISHAPIASALLCFVGFLFGYLWLQRDANANKSENNASKTLLKLKEAEYLNLEKNIKTKDDQIEDLTKEASKIKLLESGLATSAENLKMSKIEIELQNKTKTEQDKEINNYIDRLNLLLNINKYHDLSDFELQKQATAIIIEIKIYYEEAKKQLESIMPSDYDSYLINISRSSENHEFNNLLNKIKQDFSDKYKNDILLLIEALISRTGGNDKKVTSLAFLGIDINNHNKNKPVFDNIGSTITQIENLAKQIKGFRL